MAVFQQTAQATLNLLPVVREIPADLETPVSVYLKLAGHGPSFLLESVTGGEQLARYSFIGVGPGRAFVLRDGVLDCFASTGLPGALYPTLAEDCRTLEVDDPLKALSQVMARYQYQATPDLPRFAGGLVGFLGYEAMRYFEPSVGLTPDGELPEAIFLLTDNLVAFDHAYGRLLIIANAQFESDASDTMKQSAIANAEARLDAIQDRLSAPLPAYQPEKAVSQSSDLQSNHTHAGFLEAIGTAKEHIRAGDIFQVVLSQKLSRETDAHPFDIYRALRRLNPSPYMFFFDFDTLAGELPLHMIGASPEVHVRLEGRTALLRPIAGTRRRGENAGEDSALEHELINDPKERAEHVMLVDLGRNDLGRVCEYGSVHVPELMKVERYSHVMHIVSQVEGQLCPEYDAFDLLRATFPAGTVSGAPKIRAMQIINDLEREPRGAYAGAVGYISYAGAMDTCITIRTLIMRGRKVTVQAGAGIVADSDPESEYLETIHKARALAVAVQNAEDNLRSRR